MRAKLIIAVGALLGLAGCVAYPAEPAYYAPPPRPVVVAPPPPVYYHRPYYRHYHGYRYWR